MVLLVLVVPVVLFVVVVLVVLVLVLVVLLLVVQLVFFLVLLGACVFGGIPIAFAFGTATMAYLALATHAPLSIVVGRMDEGMSHMVLLAVPLLLT